VESPALPARRDVLGADEREVGGENGVRVLPEAKPSLRADPAEALRLDEGADPEDQAPRVEEVVEIDRRHRAHLPAKSSPRRSSGTA
jgi:hypothetical protein